MDEVLQQYNNFSANLDVPLDLKSKAVVDSDKIANSPFTRESMLNNLNNVAYSIKVEPLTFVDERKYYSIIDACYKIYEQLLAQEDVKYSKTFAWIVANVGLLGMFLKVLCGDVLSGREVERLVDLAIRSPTYFMLKYILYSVVHIGIGVAPAVHYAFGGSENGVIAALSAGYIIQVIINMIKLSVQIRKAQTKEIDALRPIV